MGDIYININTENFDKLSKVLNSYNLNLLKNKKYLKDDDVEHLKVENIKTDTGSFILDNLSNFLINIVENGKKMFEETGKYMFKLVDTDSGHLLENIGPIDNVSFAPSDTFSAYHMIDNFGVTLKENGYLSCINIELKDIKYAKIVNRDRNNSFIRVTDRDNITSEVNNAFNFLMNKNAINFIDLLLDDDNYIYTNTRRLYCYDNINTIYTKFKVKSAYKNNFIVNFTNDYNHIENTSGDNIYEYITNVNSGFNATNWNEWEKIPVSCDVVLNLEVDIDKISKELIEFTNNLFENAKDKNINLPKNNLGILQFVKIE